jgi:hypothetical protein
MRKNEAFDPSKRKKLLILVTGLLLLSISGELLFAHLIRQWSYDRQIGTLHISSGVLTGAAGVVCLILLFRQECNTKGIAWKKEFFRIFLTYLILQLAASVLVGLIGVFLQNVFSIPYPTVKTVLDVLTTVFQNLVRVMLVYYLSERLKCQDWKKDKKKLKRPLIAAAVLSIISILISFVPAEGVRNVLNIIWDTLFLLGFTVYFFEKIGRER